MSTTTTTIAPAPSATTTSSKTRIEWTPVDGVQSAVWVGKYNDRFVGMIEARWGKGFVVTTRLGQSLGVYPTIEGAQHAFDEKLRTQ